MIPITIPVTCMIIFLSQRCVEKRIYGQVVSIPAPRLKIPNPGCTQILINFELPVCNCDVCCAPPPTMDR